MNINTVTIAGNLTRDPEVKRLEGSTPQLVVFAIANNRRWRGGDGELREETSYLEVEAWGGPARLVAEHFSRGKAICVEGRLRQERWETDGQKRSRVVVVAERIHFVGPKD